MKAVTAPSMQGGAAENTLVVFAAICTSYVFISFLTNQIVLTDEVFARSLAPSIDWEQLERFHALRDRWSWLAFALLPILLAAKAGYTAVWLAFGTVLVDWDVSFRRVFNVAVLSECVFVAVVAIRLIAAIWVVEVATVDDFERLLALSVRDLVYVDQSTFWLEPAFRALSAYELAYCAMLAYLLGRQAGKEFSESLYLVVVAYGSGFLLWLALLTFLALQLA